tara:strand:+ start:8370 stop:9410 length:1041 start_codon:yes stop_codon:yes gene_type:complete
MKSNIKLNQTKWARDNHDEECRMRNMLIKEKEKWVCQCNQDESDSDNYDTDCECKDGCDCPECLDERELEAVKKEQLQEMEDRKKEQADRMKWKGEADTEPQNHKTTPISKKIPEKKKKVEKKEDKQITHNLSIIPQTFHQKWYAVFGDTDLRKMIMENVCLDRYSTRLETEVIRKAMYLQDGRLFTNKVHMFNIHLVCSNIYDYHYYLSDTHNLKAIGRCCKGEWEQNIKRVFASVLRNVEHYIDFGFIDYNNDFNDDKKQNKDDPNSNKKKYNNGNIKLPFLDLLFNGNKYGSCLMRKKRKEDCPLYLILIGFFNWLYETRKIDDVVEDEVLGYDGIERWCDFK